MVYIASKAFLVFSSCQTLPVRRNPGGQFRCVLALITASTAFGAIAGDLPRERLIYTTLRPANKELYLFEPGAAAKAITNDPALDYDATFSPDGRWVVFCSERA